MVGKVGHSQIIVSLHVTNVPTCTGSNAKTLVLHQRLHCREHFGAMYVSTGARRPQSSISEHTFATSGPLATDTIKFGVRGRVLEAFWSRRPERNCKTSWPMMPRVSKSCRTTSSGICLSRFLTSRRTQRPSGREV